MLGLFFTSLAGVSVVYRIKDPKAEEQGRDRALALLAEYRGALIAIARNLALRIARANGTVTSPQVLEALKAAGYGHLLDEVDPRFMGVVFRRGWQRVGWLEKESRASHARPVTVWALEESVPGKDSWATAAVSELEAEIQRLQTLLRLAKDREELAWLGREHTWVESQKDPAGWCCSTCGVEDQGDGYKVAAPCGVSLTRTWCSVCNGAQFNTPCGVTCKNGHGGAAPREVP